MGKIRNRAEIMNALLAPSRIDQRRLPPSVVGHSIPSAYDEAAWALEDVAREFQRHACKSNEEPTEDLAPPYWVVVRDGPVEKFIREVQEEAIQW